MPQASLVRTGLAACVVASIAGCDRPRLAYTTVVDVGVDIYRGVVDESRPTHYIETGFEVYESSGDWAAFFGYDVETSPLPWSISTEVIGDRAGSIPCPENTVESCIDAARAAEGLPPLVVPPAEPDRRDRDEDVPAPDIPPVLVTPSDPGPIDPDDYVPPEDPPPPFEETGG